MRGRILFVASTHSHILNFHRAYLAEFRRLGYGVDVACGGREMEIAEADAVYPISFEKSITSPRNIVALKELRQLLIGNHYDLISCHTSLASFFVRLAASGLKKRPKIACISHGYLFDQQSSVPKRLLLSSAEKMTAPVTDLLMVMNHWDEIYARKHKLGKKIVWIPGMGVNFHRFTPLPTQQGRTLREELGFDTHHFLFIYAAEFSKRKSQAHLIEALSKTPEHIILLLPGEGILKQFCIELAHQLGVSHRVVFPGHVDMPVWYAASNAAISSSRSEGLPFNIMEAMYCGLPVIASQVKGHEDLITHQKTGLLFPYGDCNRCAVLMCELAQDATLCQFLGVNAHQVAESLSLEVVFPQVMAQYGALVPVGEPSQISAEFDKSMV